jgi:hypothetical protein
VGSLFVSCFIFAVILTSIFAGMLLRKVLPEHHLSDESKDVVRLGTGLVATLGALVLGLLIASAKSSYDTQSGQIKQITANVILLDRLLAKYGPEARRIREDLRQGINPVVARIWGEQSSNASAAPFEASTIVESTILDIQALSPANDIQKALKSWAVAVCADLAKTRLLLFAQKGNPVPAPFLAVLVFWLVIIFLSFSLFAQINGTVFAFLAVVALSAAGALFLILELSHPFSGLIQVPSAPLVKALAPLGP